MAFFISGALGVSTAAGALIGVSTLGTVVSAYGQIEAGKAQESALKAQAEQERIAAEGRELERQQKLNAALAANASTEAQCSPCSQCCRYGCVRY
jgi:hypothetical protein